MQVTRVEGRVAQVLDERRLVINRGSAGGAKIGMRFEVKAETPLEIRDPETDQILDYLDRVKVRVEAIEVRERITICATYEYRRVGSAFGLDPEESYVRRGDRVVQFTEPA